MQIRDMLGQYSQNVKNGTEELMSAQGTQKLVSSMQELEPGSTFEGTVNSVKNGKVVLALGNGQTITARLDGKVSIQPGESMFFQVRSNDGTTIALRPYVQAGNINNPILLNALTAAGRWDFARTGQTNCHTATTIAASTDRTHANASCTTSATTYSTLMSSPESDTRRSRPRLTRTICFNSTLHRVTKRCAPCTMRSWR